MTYCFTHRDEGTILRNVRGAILIVEALNGECARALLRRHYVNDWVLDGDHADRESMQWDPVETASIS